MHHSKTSLLYSTSLIIIDTGIIFLYYLKEKRCNFFDQDSPPLLHPCTHHIRHAIFKKFFHHILVRNLNLILNGILSIFYLFVLFLFSFNSVTMRNPIRRLYDAMDDIRLLLVPSLSCSFLFCRESVSPNRKERKEKRLKGEKERTEQGIKIC